MKDAMRARDTLRLSTLRMLKSAFEYHLIEKKADHLGDADAITVIKKQVKQRQDSIEGFEKGGRTDLADKEKAELEILKEYLPEELAAEQIAAIIDATISELGAQSKADMGKVMKAVQPKLAGRADNRQVSQLVAARLT